MTTLEIVFWAMVAVVFYTYIGYGILLYLLVKIKEALFHTKKEKNKDFLPDVTILIAAYNEENVVDAKMANTIALDYPEEKKHIVWVTDGSNDRTVEFLAKYPQATVLHSNIRAGKTAAINRAIPLIHTEITVFTDANTMLCPEAIKVMAYELSDQTVGCVAGEKRVAMQEKQGATAGEGIYWKYESTIKSLDYRLYSAVGAAGELFAIRTAMFETLPTDTLLDDFIISLKIAQKGYKIAYNKDAYAVESASADIKEEAKRKVRISAGGLQSVWRLGSLLNVFKYGTLSFQYISHRVLRWTLTPILFFALLPVNVILLFTAENTVLYSIFLALQILFYACGIAGYALALRKLKNKILFVPYYFLMMNVNVLKGLPYLISHRGSGVWEKAKRS
ncbi:MAG: glycosyltransferase family 2 protein [Flavobacteriales bacterium]|nr:glycosyltransferase family 2 protein [Flavobacteriales bacterium]